MKVNLLNQKPCIPSWPGVFLFDAFFSVVLSKSMCISAFGLSLSPSNSLVILFIHSAFPLCLFGCHIFYKIVRFLLHPVVGMFLCHLLQVVSRIFFRCFGMFYFVCIVLPFVDMFSIFLLSPVLLGLFLQVVLLFFLVLPFHFVPTYSSVILFQHIPASFWPVCRFFICVSCRISHPGFDFFIVLTN